MTCFRHVRALPIANADHTELANACPVENYTYPSRPMPKRLRWGSWIRLSISTVARSVVVISGYSIRCKPVLTLMSHSKPPSTLSLDSVGRHRMSAYRRTLTSLQDDKKPPTCIAVDTRGRGRGRKAMHTATKKNNECNQRKISKSEKGK